MPTCPHCQEVGTHQHIMLPHLATCTMFPLTCPNGCGTMPMVPVGTPHGRVSIGPDKVQLPWVHRGDASKRRASAQQREHTETPRPAGISCGEDDQGPSRISTKPSTGYHQDLLSLHLIETSWSDVLALQWMAITDNVAMATVLP